MNKTFSQIKTNVGNNVQDTSPETATLIGRFINNIYADFLRRFNWEFYNYDYSFSTVSGTQDYVLPRDFGKELYVYDSTNKVELSFKSLQQIVQDKPATLSSSGEGTYYSILTKRYNNSPTSGAITAVSSSGDDSTQSVLVRGISGNVEMVDTISLNGTTPAVGTISFTSLISVSKSATTTGTVTLTADSGSTTVAVMSPQELEYIRKFIRISYIPSSVYTVKVPYMISPLPMTVNTDVCFAPDDIIEAGATMLAWRYKRQMAKAQEWERSYEKLIVNNIWNQENQINQVKQISVEAQSRDLY